MYKQWLLWLVAGVCCSGAVHAQTAAGVTKKSATKLQSTAAPEPLTPEQMDAANHVALGKMPCDMAQHVTVRPDANNAGRFVLELGKQIFHMVPVVTTTGAVRLEDSNAGAVWLQLANKSMLMQQKLGKRLADACMTPAQLELSQSLQRNPSPSVLEAPAVVAESASK